MIPHLWNETSAAWSAARHGFDLECGRQAPHLLPSFIIYHINTPFRSDDSACWVGVYSKHKQQIAFLLAQLVTRRHSLPSPVSLPSPPQTSHSGPIARRANNTAFHSTCHVQQKLFHQIECSRCTVLRTAINLAISVFSRWDGDKQNITESDE